MITLQTPKFTGREGYEYLRPQHKNVFQESLNCFDIVNIFKGLNLLFEARKKFHKLQPHIQL
jgi:hypothetical protein